MGPHSAGADAARHHLPRKAGFAQQVVLPVAGTHLPPAGRAAHPAQVPEDHHRLAIRMRPHPHGPRSRSRTDHGHLQRLQRTVPAAGRCGADRRQIPLRSRLHLLSGQHRPQEEHVRHAARLRRVRAPLGETPAAAGRRPQGAGRGGDSARDRRARTARDAPPAGVYPQRRPPGRLQRRIGVPLHLAAREFRNSAARSDGLRHARGDIRYLGDPRSGGRRRHPRSPTPCCGSKPIRRSAPNRSPMDSNGSNSSLGNRRPGSCWRFTNRSADRAQTRPPPRIVGAAVGTDRSGR